MKGVIKIDYSLLKNNTYLTLLAYYDKQELPSFVDLSKKIGVSRQTASNKVKELINNGLIELDDKDCVYVNNKLNIDIEKLKYYLDTHNIIDIVELKEILFGLCENKVQLAKELDIARSSLYLDEHSVVYGIQSEGRIKYIGTTQHFEDRVSQHIKKRPFLNPSNFLILKDNVGKEGFNIELELIHLLQPEWNQMGK